MKAHNLQYILDAVRATQERRKVVAVVHALADESDAGLALIAQELETRIELEQARVLLRKLEDEARARWCDSELDSPSDLSDHDLNQTIEHCQQRIQNLVEMPMKLGL